MKISAVIFHSNGIFHSFIQLYVYVLQLRDEIDSGREVHLTAEHNPHDIGGLLKEFFRDLPDPLLTRDLYSAWVATRSKLGTRFKIWVK